jgi:hypothetical protein
LLKQGIRLSNQDSNFATTLRLSRRGLLAGASAIGGLAFAKAVPSRAVVTTSDIHGAEARNEI